MFRTNGTPTIAFLLLLGACSKTPAVQEIPTYQAQNCYRTLAEVDCHEQPLAGEAYREVAWYQEPSGQQVIETDFQCLDLMFFDKRVVRIGCSGP